MSLHWIDKIVTQSLMSLTEIYNLGLDLQRFSRFFVFISDPENMIVFQFSLTNCYILGFENQVSYSFRLYK